MRLGFRFSHVARLVIVALCCGACASYDADAGLDISSGKHAVILIDPVTCASTSRIADELRELKMSQGWVRHVGLIGVADLTAAERRSITVAFALPLNTTFVSRATASALIGSDPRGVSIALFVGGRRVHSVANGSLRPDSVLLPLTTLFGSYE
jgi:hypothetical protein